MVIEEAKSKQSAKTAAGNQQSPHPIDFSFQKKSTRKKVQINATTATEPNCHNSHKNQPKISPKLLIDPN